MFMCIFICIFMVSFMCMSVKKNKYRKDFYLYGIYSSLFLCQRESNVKTSTPASGCQSTLSCYIVYTNFV